MTDSPLQQFLRDQLRIRVEPEMSNYILSVAAQSRQAIPIFAIDARTGIPRRENLDPRIIPSNLLPAPRA